MINAEIGWCWIECTPIKCVPIINLETICAHILIKDAFCFVENWYFKLQGDNQGCADTYYIGESSSNTQDICQGCQYKEEGKGIFSTSNHALARLLPL